LQNLPLFVKPVYDSALFRLQSNKIVTPYCTVHEQWAALRPHDPLSCLTHSSALSCSRTRKSLYSPFIHCLFLDCISRKHRSESR